MVKLSEQVKSKSLQNDKKNNEQEEKLNELKIELLKQKSKRKDIKKEIARLLTIKTKDKKIRGFE